ncbi:AraC family transcriptional regulator [Vibrio aquaticus]|uniref:AraC family transcriptional regulator n=1 Tax=Vibrio aquaticus TaxID=2496559 RepID=A0A3S0MMB5_9VIBR|nr:helix-turn-helix transcriptional regulator [Vibrio aquaticus]RTZ17862.1 AraC family transcriptional regulator [Vibrio aquaticus]
MIAWKQSISGYEWLIHQVWYLEVEDGEVIDPKPHLIPNPRGHLLITPPEQPYQYESGVGRLSGSGSHLLTASEHLLLLEDTPPIKRIGITFRPDGLYILNSGLDTPANQCGWFDWLSPLFDSAFQESLWHDTSKQALLLAIRNHFDDLGLKPCTTKPYRLTQTVLAAMDKQAVDVHRPLLDVEELARLCLCSRRTLERSFKQIVGLSIKQYQQMSRLEQMILALYQQNSEVDWTAFSQQFGFSDQSHLIRTLKQQLRTTPSKYLKSRDLTIDVYGDFE